MPLAEYHIRERSKNNRLPDTFKVFPYDLTGPFSKQSGFPEFEIERFQFQEEEISFDVIEGTRRSGLTAKLSHKIQDVKRKMMEGGWQEEEPLILMHSGEYLQDHLSLAYYDIRNVCNSLFPNNQVADIWQKSTI